MQTIFKNGFAKKLFSIALALVLVLSVLPMASVRAHAGSATVGSLDELKSIIKTDGTVTKLTKDYERKDDGDTGIDFLRGEKVHIDLNGHTIDGRGITAGNDSYLFYLVGQNTYLTISDSSADKSGKITGFSGYKFSGGFRGGAICVFSGNLTINGGTFTNNYAQSGAVIYNNNGNVIINGGVFTDNATYQGTSQSGSGGVIFNYSYLTINGGTFKNNKAYNGGVIFNYYDTVITGGTFTENDAEWGGAIENYYATLTITGGTFTKNSYAAVDFNGGDLVIGGSVVMKDNKLGSRDAGIEYWEGSVYISSTTPFTQDAVVGFFPLDTGTIIASGVTSEVMSHIKSENPNLSLVLENGALKAIDHVYGGAWSADTTHHFHACLLDGCTAYTGAEPHVYGTEGDARFTCSVCGYVGLPNWAQALISDAKAEAIEAIDAAVAGDTAANVVAAAEEAKALINGTDNLDVIANAKAEGIAAINAAKAANISADELGAAKVDAVKAIDAAVAGDKTANVLAAANAAKDAINAAETVEEVAAAKDAGVAAIADTKEANVLKALNDAKDAAKKAIDTEVGAVIAQKVVAAGKNAKAAIDAAATVEEVNAAKEAGLSVIKAAKSVNTLLEAKKAAKQAIIDEVGSETAANVLAAAKAAIAEIDNATTVADVTTAKNNGVNAIKAAKKGNADSAKAVESAKAEALKAIEAEQGGDNSVLVSSAATVAKNNIAGAATLEAVAAAKDEGVAAIKAAKKANANNALTAIKDAAKNEINMAVNGDPTGNVTGVGNFANVVGIANVYKAKITNASSEAAIAELKEAGIAAVKAAKRANQKPAVQIPGNKPVEVPAAGTVADISALVGKNDMGVTFSKLDAALGLTDAQKAEGMWVWLELVAKDSSADAAVIEKALNGKTVGAYMDISVFMQAVGAEKQGVNVLKNALTVSIVVPEELRQEGRTFSIICAHNGAASEIEAESYDAATGTLTFKANKFSTYALAYADPAEEPAVNVQTVLVILVLALVVAGAVTAVVYTKKRNAKK